MKYGKESNIKCIVDLPDRLPEKITKHLFVDRTYLEVMKK